MTQHPGAFVITGIGKQKLLHMLSVCL